MMVEMIKEMDVINVDLKMDGLVRELLLFVPRFHLNFVEMEYIALKSDRSVMMEMI